MLSTGNRTVIGIFVVGATAIVVAAVLVFGGGRFLKRTGVFVLYFDGSVSGLNEGAPVRLKGVTVGSVIDINVQLLLRKMETRTRVLIEVYPDAVDVEAEPGVLASLESDRPQVKEIQREYLQRLIDHGLRARLQVQSMVTGQLMVDLDFYPRTEVRLAGVDTEYDELPTIPSPLEKLSRTLDHLPLDEIINDLKLIIQGLEQLINARETKAALASLDEAMVDLKGMARKLNEGTGPLVTELQALAKDTRKLIGTVNTEVKPAVTSINDTAREVRSFVQNLDHRIEPLVADVSGTAQAGTTALKEAGGLLADLRGLAPRDSALAYEIANTLRSVAQAADSVKVLADQLEQRPEALLRGKPGG